MTLAILALAMAQPVALAPPGTTGAEHPVLVGVRISFGQQGAEELKKSAGRVLKGIGLG